jgi:hypothetical protein
MTMNIVSGRLRLGLSAIVGGVFLLSLVPVTAAHAATPMHFRFTDSGSVTDTTSCGFPITVTFQSNVVGTAFFDAQGNFQRATFATNSVGTDSANGITLRETDHLVDFVNSAGYDKETGLPIHIQDGGVVIRDAGYILFNPDGSVSFLHGPHPQLEGDTAALCAALS